MIELFEHQLADLAGQGMIGFSGFQQVIQLGVGDVAVAVQPGLADGVFAQVVQVLGGEGSRIDPGKARVTGFDHVLLNQGDWCALFIFVLGFVVHFGHMNKIRSLFRIYTGLPSRETYIFNDDRAFSRFGNRFPL